jgi:DEAD/DEAH box helicase domain-containing protein
MDPEALLAALGNDPERLVHVARIPASRGVVARGFPLDPRITEKLDAIGVPGLWAHQADGLEAVRSGSDVIMATGTASGKSLVYQVATLEAMLAEPKATALFLFPTKALAQDQVSRMRKLALPGTSPSVYDGDTAQEERAWIRQSSQIVISNPDMLHAGILPQHQRWAGFLRMLRLVVVDEAHLYRGVFGAHIASVLRRLRRACARYGSDPLFVLSSATIGNPAEHAGRLVGKPFHAVTEDASAHGERVVVSWDPPIVDEDAPVPRRSVIAETGAMLARLVDAGVPTLAFTKARRATELVAQIARENSDSPAASITSYRGGYLSEERREVEQGLHSGTLLGVAATTALELGIDVRGLDAVLVAGFPGTRAAFRQQIGRAGRSMEASLGVFLADDDPLDQYLLRHPEELLEAPNEAAIMDPSNPTVLAPHLACAATEIPLAADDADMFGDGFVPSVAALVENGTLIERGGRWTYAGRGEPHRDMGLRDAGPSIQIVETDTGRLLGSAGPSQAMRGLHAGAIYLHLGEQYEVEALDLETGVAFVHPSDAPWTTHARAVSDVRIIGHLRETMLASVPVRFGKLTVTTQVVSYARRRRGSGELMDEHVLELPESVLHTVGVWLEVDAVFGPARIGPPDVPGALHAAEHAAIGVLPAIAMCDRWDIGGLSTPLHPDTGAATIIIYDGASGGAGFAERSFSVIDRHLRVTLDAIEGCRCRAGCPSCVQSPKCGNGNEPLDKDAAVRLLRGILS